jgi:hypothetical protein
MSLDRRPHRTAGKPGERKRMAIGQQFAARTIEMLLSPAYRAMSLTAHRCLARIEIEHARHGGKENGKLPITFAQFADYCGGTNERIVAAALRELDALGFTRVTERGRAGNREFRRPNLYRLTYRHTDDTAPPTNEWKCFDTLEQAQYAADFARKNRISRAKSAGTRTGQKCRDGQDVSRAKSDRTGSRAKSDRTLYILGSQIPNSPCSSSSVRGPVAPKGRGPRAHTHVDDKKGRH